jgi:hypothetical protein
MSQPLRNDAGHLVSETRIESDVPDFAYHPPEEDQVRAIGLDVHLDFCEVAIWERGEVRSAGRIETKPEQIELFAQSLGAEDRVALGVTGNTWEIARLIEPHVAQVVVVSPGDTGIRQAA